MSEFWLHNFRCLDQNNKYAIITKENSKHKNHVRAGNQIRDHERPHPLRNLQTIEPTQCIDWVQAINLCERYVSTFCVWNMIYKACWF